MAKHRFVRFSLDRDGDALSHIGDAAFGLGDLAAAVTYGNRALASFVAVGDAYGEAFACNLIGACLACDMGTTANTSAAGRWFERSIAICRRLNRFAFAARVTGNAAERKFFAATFVARSR